jgi:hypothetical protein
MDNPHRTQKSSIGRGSPSAMAWANPQTIHPLRWLPLTVPTLPEKTPNILFLHVLIFVRMNK